VDIPVLKTFDCIIKLLALVLLGVAVFTYWQRRDNGRYAYHEQPATPDYPGGFGILDTRTGTIYTAQQGTWYEFHPQTGTGAAILQKVPAK